MISGMLSIISVDENNICQIVIWNGTPYDITLEKVDILGIIEIEKEKLVPLMENFISSVCQNIHNCFPKVKKKRLSRDEIKKCCHLQILDEYIEKYIDILYNYSDALGIYKYDLGLAKDFPTKSYSNCMI